MSSTTLPPDSPWDPAYPVAKNQNPSTITRSEVLKMLREGKQPGKDFVLVDLRREDRTVSCSNTYSQSIDISSNALCLQGGTVRGSINLPAQSLYPAIPTLYTMFTTAKIGSVIWYCGELRVDFASEYSDRSWPGSSKHRGLRGAAWMDDYIKERGDPSLRSLVLLDGIRGWANAGTEYTAFMDEYDESAWR